jgi:hypothetical protein
MRVHAVALSTLAAFSLVSAAFAQEKVAFTPKYEVGPHAKFDFKMLVEMSGMEVKLASTVNQAVKKVGETIDWEAGFEGLKLTINGEDQDLPVSPVSVKTKDGIPVDIYGGIEGSDNRRTYLVLHHLVPSKEVAPGDKFTGTIPGSGEAGEVTIEAKYEGPEEVAGKKGFKFTSSGAEKGSSFKWTQTYWLAPDSKLMKLETKFKALPIPGMNSEVDGSLSLTTK